MYSILVFWLWFLGMLNTILVVAFTWFADNIRTPLRPKREVNLVTKSYTLLVSFVRVLSKYTLGKFNSFRYVIK